MAIYTPQSMQNAGTPGQLLTAGVEYNFRLQNKEKVPIDPPNDMTLTSQWGNYGTSYLILDGTGLATQQAGGTPPSVTGPLQLNLIPASSIPFTTTVDATFNFDVAGGLQGSRAVMAITTAAGVFTTARVINGGENFISGDTITITQEELQAAGFSNANAVGLIFDVFPDYVVNTFPNSTTITGSFKDFLKLINEPSLTTGSTGFGISMLNSGSAAGLFTFTPTTTIPQNSYAIRSTGPFSLTIAP
tara:strand:- start:400 stop:1137 length:738 start_codon:yes stop_codon:yes gene_type:complete